MDKSWMNQPRYSQEYLVGLETFMDFAFGTSRKNGVILCPCKECKLIKSVNREAAKEHLIVIGFIKGYNQWIAHGEKPSSSVNVQVPSSSTNVHVPPRSDTTPMVVDDIHNLLQDAFGVHEQDNDDDATMECPEGANIPTGDAAKFFKLLESAKKPLYEGCEKFSKLHFILRLLRIKCLGSWSNKKFDMLLELLIQAFPEAMADLPKSYYECEKMLKDLGLGYEKIDACVNDCTLYWGDNSEKTSCETCLEPRWQTSEKDPTGTKRKIAHKVLWYFPLKPRLQRLFMSSKTASHLRWHAEGRTKDGYMRHPADSPSWQGFDSKYPKFAEEPRNVRLGLASDGFNPFGNMNVSHSTWPVILVPYNLPPWMCMKEQYTMLSLIIPGPTAPGNNMDVYLQPLIKDLKELWEDGINTYDASRKKNFQLYASLLWTISDFPGYANLSGWSTKGRFACPVCHEYTHSEWLENGGKFCYMGHRRFLDRNHHFRKNSEHFDGKEEDRQPPPRLSGKKVLDCLSGINFKFGKKVSDNPDFPFNWKKKSIFFDLPYWKDIILQHNLDVMHIEKNVCESILGTLMDTDKSKDNEKSRLDLQKMGIRPELHPVVDEAGKSSLPKPAYRFKIKEKGMFCRILKGVKVPDGYASNISRSVRCKPPKILGLKSHDYHILMQQLLPVAIRKTLPKSVRVVLIKLSRYFRELCSKAIYPPDVIRMEKEIAITLCELERIFPPSFFDVMVHLTIHLAAEVRLRGPVHYRWMYPIERYLGILKRFCRNRRKPEGSMAQGYIADECLSFCSMYLPEYVDPKTSSVYRTDEPEENKATGLQIFTTRGQAIGKATPKIFDDETLKKGHLYVLFNCKEVQPYLEEHLRIVKQTHSHLAPHQIENLHNDEFPKWFSDKVKHLQNSDDDPVLKDLKILGKGPNNIGLSYDQYIVNGFRFHTSELEEKRKTQNNGVTNTATTSCFSSVRDKNPQTGELDYYGIINNIIELDYVHRRVVLFDCDWVSRGSRLKQDDDGFTLVNFSNVRRHIEPFILSYQAKQVFYIEDPVSDDWKVVVVTSARNEFNMEPLADIEAYLQSNLGNPTSDTENDEVIWVNSEDEGVTTPPHAWYSGYFALQLSFVFPLLIYVFTPLCYAADLRWLVVDVPHILESVVGFLEWILTVTRLDME